MDFYQFLKFCKHRFLFFTISQYNTQNFYHSKKTQLTVPHYLKKKKYSKDFNKNYKFIPADKDMFCRISTITGIGYKNVHTLHSEIYRIETLSHGPKMWRFICV